ncbi:hypothetical protein [Streptomyces sp. NPDC005435]|uniref:hypothetical protein n=1 Tax=Streptomyces sp. NPDC005435 TaxID=3154464 RepID=UPI0034522EF2
MDVVARHLAAIDRLRAPDLPEGGAGYRTVVLETGRGTGPETRERVAGDLHALREAIAARLDERWGGGPAWGLLTLRVRLARGESIPEPWATLCLRTDELDVWQVGERGMWVAVGVADRDAEDEAELLATVTWTPPP